METLKTQSPQRSSGEKALDGRLIVLDASSTGRIFTANTDGSGLKTIVTGCRVPDGVVVDVEAGHIYWTNMGNPAKDDGSIERVDLDGRNRRTIVPEGGTFTPKQMHLEKASGKLYWCDREGMRVMRCNLGGSNVETLLDTSGGDPRPGPDIMKHCVGITVDPQRGKLYWTQKGPGNGGVGRIFRANLELPKGETPANRSDVEVLFDHLPEPIDLELDLQNHVLYWTDRGNPPRGNSVSRARFDPATGKLMAQEIIVTDLMEAIGIALDVAGDRMFVTDLAGDVYTARLDGSEKRTLIAANGNLTGIAFVQTPNTEK
jgi:DNA-binding beta-propeller fold protein YncE